MRWQRAQKKLKPHLKNQWVIPPDKNAEFVAAMEDVLEVYQRPYDVVCLDEQSKRLVKETREPIPAKTDQPAREDYEYERNGTANLFMIFEPLVGWRHVKVTERTRGVFVLKASSNRLTLNCKQSDQFHQPSVAQNQDRLRRGGRRTLFLRRKYCVGDGQSEHAQSGVVV